MQWLQDSSHSNVDKLSNVRCKASWYIRNKKKEYLKAKIEELKADSKVKNIRYLYRSISDFKKGYQSRTNALMDEKGIWLQIPTVFWLGGFTISLSYW